MNEKSLERLRNMYPAGTRVRLLHMDDIQAPPYNTLGTIKNIDDISFMDDPNEPKRSISHVKMQDALYEIYEFYMKIIAKI